MRIPSGKTDVYLYFVAVDSTDLKTRKTGLSGFTVYRSRNAGAATIYTTPTITELSAANMPGVYALLIDEDTTITSGADSEEYTVHITVATMAPVTRTFELYRPVITSGQTITVANGAADADIERIQGTVISTPATAGILDVNAKNWNNLTTVALPLVPTVAGRTLDVSTTGEAGIDWANVGSPTTALALTGTTIASTQKVDIETIKTNPVVNAGTVTFPTTATLASTTNITAGTITTATNVTTVNGLAANVITAAATAADFGTEVASAIWQDSTAGDFTVASSIGKALYVANIAPGAAGGHFIAGSNAATTVNITGNITGNLSGSVGSVTGSVGSVTSGVTVTTNNDKTGYGLSSAAVQAIWDALTSALTTVGSIGKLLVTNIDAAISSRMATYTQPTGFLAATFPATVASPTNITAGTITTVTNLTNAPTAGDLTSTMKTSVENAVWDATMASHLTAGSTGATLNGAGSAGDPWLTLLPGAYGAGTAGKIIGDNINASISSVKAKTDNLTFSVAGQVDSNAKSMNSATILGVGTSGDLWRGS